MKGRMTLAIGYGTYSYTGPRHKCIPDEWLLNASRDLARKNGVANPACTRALAGVTQSNGKGGQPPHKDHECIFGSCLLAIGAEGERTVCFENNGQYIPLPSCDYISPDGAHTSKRHKVLTNGYSASITWRVLKGHGGDRKRWPPKATNQDNDAWQDGPNNNASQTPSSPSNNRAPTSSPPNNGNSAQSDNHKTLLRKTSFACLDA